jgi:hypothetical protein
MQSSLQSSPLGRISERMSANSDGTWMNFDDDPIFVIFSYTGRKQFLGQSLTLK